jgi:hypothetical protein
VELNDVETRFGEVSALGKELNQVCKISVSPVLSTEYGTSQLVPVQSERTSRFEMVAQEVKSLLQ